MYVFIYIFKDLFIYLFISICCLILWEICLFNNDKNRVFYKMACMFATTQLFSPQCLGTSDRPLYFRYFRRQVKSREASFQLVSF